MIRLPKSLVLAAAGAGLFTSLFGDASACDGKRGGGYRPVYRPAYTQQCQQQVYPYQQQPLVQQQQFQQQQFPQQFQQGQMPPQVQQLTQQGQQFQQQGQQFSQQGLPQQQMQSGIVAGQNSSASIQPGGASAAVANPGVAGGSAANVSAIGALGGVDSANTNLQSQAIASAPAQNGSAPVAGTQFGGAAVNNAAVNNAPVATGNAAQAPAASAEQSAIESALQALMGDTSAAQPVSAAPQAAPTGEFSATISNGSTIRLNLRADGSFVWLANKGGKASNFQGTFSVNGGSLTLLRGNDSQKLEGSFALTQNGFSLRLAGQNNNENLTFVRG